MSTIAPYVRPLALLLCLVLGSSPPTFASATQDPCPGLKAQLDALEKQLAAVNAALQELDEEQTFQEELWEAGDPSCYDLNNRWLIHNFVPPNAFIVGAFCNLLVIGYRAILADIAAKTAERNGLLNQIEQVRNRQRLAGCIRVPVELPDDDEVIVE